MTDTLEIERALLEILLRIGDCAVVDAGSDLRQHELQQQLRLEIAELLVEVLGAAAAIPQR